MVDASVAIKWFVAEPDSSDAAALLRHPLSAPDLRAAECANILWKKVARAELTLNEAEVVALALEKAAVALHPTRARLATVMKLACELDCTTYDCFYLALAQELQQPLVTADLRLVSRARADRAARFATLLVVLNEFDHG